MVVIIIQKVLLILELGKIIYKMEKGKKYGLIKLNMKENLKKGKNGEKGN
jgi:hypothetical protein